MLNSSLVGLNVDIVLLAQGLHRGINICLHPLRHRGNRPCKWLPFWEWKMITYMSATSINPLNPPPPPAQAFLALADPRKVLGRS